MTEQHDLLKNIEFTLNELHTALSQFKVTLSEEKKILETNQLGSLEEKLHTKKMLVNSIQTIMAQLQILLDQKGDFHEKNITHFIGLYPPEKKKALLSQWEDIKEISKTCEQSNLANGALVTILKNYNDAFLNLLSRRSSETTYTNQTNKPIAPLSTREHKA